MDKPFQRPVNVEFAIGASLDSNMLKTREQPKKNGNLRRFTVGIFYRAKPELTILLKQTATTGLEHCPTK